MNTRMLHAESDASNAALANLELVRLDGARVAKIEWRQPRWTQRVWELRADGALAGVLRWRGPWRRGYDGRTASGAWTVRESFLGKLSVHGEGEDRARVSSAREGFLTTTIHREDREPLVWRSEGWLGTRHVLENRERFPLLRVHSTRGFLRTEATLHLEDAARTLPDLEPLVILAGVMTLANARRHGH